ncbi:DUF1329 domain-containing protein [Noviherbaspirillum saxi]|uniref:DUF1329 domain-containing protein n=1 Tax=Noviherbaspirillum saxi TaxID=2320863 RepID=A0A3A3FIC9_9BURK|nr:DUF1329 domain-containing protein [Noviherbaspirillum saxi]RJF92284.1 DUF1329 domain-containing protein [Noviherbaspirillum saxi]
MHTPLTLRALLLLLPLLGATTAHAATTPEEAAKLKTELMPLGGERAGNKDGSIPAWTGGYTTAIPGDKAGGRRGDPFKNEKPLFSITARNMSQYEDKLSDGQKALLKKDADYRIDVYKTHRTAAAPQAVYDNTFRNATRTKLVDEMPSNAFGGIPFPIPKSGAEVMWNHMLRWRGVAVQMNTQSYQMTADGRSILTNINKGEVQMPYYFQDSSLEEFSKTGDYWTIRVVSEGPPIRSGEAMVGRRQFDGDKDQGWIYLTGQRRVRKLPNTCCDTPHPSTMGLMTFDEIESWSGRLDRFEWKLAGKRELYIPYNGNRLLQPTSETEVLGKGYLNPDHVRWELHRVWVVDAVLRDGRRHVAPKSRYYCDEDTWLCVLGDRWDAKGQLWKTVWTQTIVAPDLPGTVGGAYGYTDLIAGNGFAGQLMNTKDAQMPIKPRFQSSVFTPDSMTGDSVR